MRRISEGTKLSHVLKVKLKTIEYRRERFLVLDMIFKDKGFRVKQVQAT